MKKLKSQRGALAIICILLAAIIILLVLILTPTVRGAGVRTAEEMDDRAEQTAEDSAYMKYAEDGEAFSAIYDSENKSFVEHVASKREFGEITAYGESAAHEGKVILVRVDDDGNITLSWIGPDEYGKVNQ